MRRLQPAAEKSLAHFLVNTPDQAPISAGGVAISPDGRRIVYRSAPGQAVPISGVLYVRELDQVDARPLGGASAAVRPSFSPNGEWVRYADNANQTLSKISIRGGPPAVVCTLDAALQGAS